MLDQRGQSHFGPFVDQDISIKLKRETLKPCCTLFVHALVQRLSGVLTPRFEDVSNISSLNLTRVAKQVDESNNESFSRLTSFPAWLLGPSSR